MFQVATEFHTIWNIYSDLGTWPGCDDVSMIMSEIVSRLKASAYRLVKAKILIVIGVLCLTLNTSGQLTVGSKAPALKPSKWVKGKPLAEKLGGKTTVVLYFATWNEASLSTFPSFNSLAKDFAATVDFVAVSTMEQNSRSAQEKLLPFLESFKGDLSFSVAVDGSDGVCAKTWIKECGLRQVPTVYVIDKGGKIAWFGYPQGNLRYTLAKLDKGEWDYEIAKSECETNRDTITATGVFMPSASMTEYGKAMAEKNFTKALEIINKQLATFPNLEGDLIESKCWLLARLKSKELEPCLKKALASNRTAECEYLNLIIWAVVEDDLKLPASTYALCETAGFKLRKQSPTNPLYLDTVALALWRNGKKAEALEIQTEAIKYLIDFKGVSQATIDEMRQRFALYSNVEKINPVP
jgi:thiol-disulfide isomerase/thioredoxin